MELRGFEPLTPSMRTRCATGLRYSPKNASQRSKPQTLSCTPGGRSALVSVPSDAARRKAGEPIGTYDETTTRRDKTTIGTLAYRRMRDRGDVNDRAFRFAVRVKPGARRDAVGGRWDGPSESALIVAVTAAAVEGKANEAVRRALAQAFDVRRQDVRLVSGARGRDKLIELDPAPPGAASRLATLLDANGMPSAGPHP